MDLLQSLQTLLDLENGVVHRDSGEASSSPVHWNLSPSESVDKLKEIMESMTLAKEEMPPNSMDTFSKKLVKDKIIPSHLRWLVMCYFGGRQTFQAASEMATNAKEVLPCGRKVCKLVVAASRLDDQAVADLIRTKDGNFTDRDYELKKKNYKVVRRLQGIQHNYEMSQSGTAQPPPVVVEERNPATSGGLSPKFPLIPFKYVKEDDIYLANSSIFFADQEVLTRDNVKSLMKILRNPGCFALLAILEQDNYASSLKCVMSNNMMRSFVRYVGLMVTEGRSRMIIEISRTVNCILEEKDGKLEDILKPYSSSHYLFQLSITSQREMGIDDKE